MDYARMKFKSGAYVDKEPCKSVIISAADRVVNAINEINFFPRSTRLKFVIAIKKKFAFYIILIN